MKNQNIIVLLTLIPLIGYSQEYEYVSFPDSGAIWSEIYLPSESSQEDPYFERFALNGEDTIINDLSYKKLYLFYDTVFKKDEATYIGGIREDKQKRVYFKGDTVVHELKPMNEFYGYEEIVLFDFSVNEGDTIKNINCLPEDDLLIIDQIDTILIGNILRKRFHFKPMWWVEWIEGIGNTKGLLFTSGDLPTNGMNNDLICFKQNNEILYFKEGYDECMPFITNVKPTNNEPDMINLFPNPAEKELNFEFNGNKIKNIVLFDCNGAILLKEMIKAQPRNQCKLSIDKYKPGIYFYKATSTKGIVYTGKFVVE